MKQNGQLTFSDDPLLTGVNQVYELIEEGNFSEAIKKFDAFMDINPNYPGIEEGYRTAKFWSNRRDEINRLNRGKETADFLMRAWDEFTEYSRNNNMVESTVYISVMKYIFFSASEHYKIAFKEQESTADNFDLLINLGTCFLILGEYKSSIETLEYARSSNKNNAQLHALLGEAYFQINETSKSLLSFKDAFFLNPSEIEMAQLKSKPILDLTNIVKQKKTNCNDAREWMPIFGFVENIFYVRRNINSQQVEAIKREIYTLETNYQTQDKGRIDASNILPRLINKYLWILDYYRFQNYDYENINEIKKRLIHIEKEIFEEYFEQNDMKK